MAREAIRWSAAGTARADAVLVNGKVFTGDAAHCFAQALAIAGDRIIAVGATDEITSLADSRTRRVDLGGRTVIPGSTTRIFITLPTRARLCCASRAWSRLGMRCSMP